MRQDLSILSSSCIDTSVLSYRFCSSHFAILYDRLSRNKVVASAPLFLKPNDMVLLDVLDVDIVIMFIQGLED